MVLSKLKRQRRHLGRPKKQLQTETLEPRHLLTGMAMITEFMAVNDSTIEDEDNEFSDWIEVANVGDSALDLEGYSLTTNPNNLNGWSLPRVTLPVGESVVVFASAKDRVDPSGNLHTNFRLSASGEYLALTAPDGETIVQEFSPGYPPQVADVSYGLATTTEVIHLVSDNAPVKYDVPINASLENQWNQPDFDDVGWSDGSTPLGYDTGETEEGDYTTFIANANPTAHWSFDDANVLDDSGNELHGQALPNIPNIFPAEFPDSPFGKALNLRHLIDSGTVSSSLPNFAALQPVDEVAVAVWVKHTGAAGDLVSMGDYYRLRINGDDSVEFAVYDGVSHTTATTNPAIAAETIGDNEWHHILGQKTATGLEIYIDGQPTTASAATVAPISYENLGTTFFMGRAGTFNNAFNFGGLLDDVAVFPTSFDTATVASMLNGGELPGGFNAEINTDLMASMNGVNSSAYVRLPFTVDDPSEFSDLTLSMQYDDGFVAYINGTEVMRVNAPGFEDEVVPYNAAATGLQTDATAVRYQDFAIGNFRDTLIVGENILAIQALNASADNPDLLVSATLETLAVRLSGDQLGYITNPTPGGPNTTVSSGLGPVIGSVVSSADQNQPSTGDEVIVESRVEKTLEDVSGVQLIYRTMFENENAVPMVDDGTGSDTVAGDGIYTAVIPANAATAGEMLRWHVRASDDVGVSTREPSTDFQPGSQTPPEYFGTVISDPAVTSDIDILYWFVENESAAGTRPGTEASLFFNGEFYDNVFVRQRGGSTANSGQSNGKTNFKFDFKGNTFRFDPNFGRVEEFNLNSTASDKAYIRQSLAFEAYSVIGGASSESFPMHVQRNGEYFGVFAFIEEPDANLLEREGLDPDGALYKFYNEFTGTGGARKKTRDYEGNQDLGAFINGVNSRNGQELTNYLFDNVDIPATLNYLVGTVITHQNDNPHKNHFLYRDSNNTGEWTFLPWDHDLTWGSNWVGTSYSDVIYADVDRITFGPVPGHNLDLIGPSHPFVNSSGYREWNNHWNRLMDAMINDERIQEMYLRRLRTAMDELLGSPDVDAESTYFNQRLNDYLATMQPDAAADQGVWNLTWGSPQTMAQAVQVIKDDYLAVRRTHLYETHSVDNVPVNIEPVLIVDENTQYEYFVPTNNDLGLSWTSIADPGNIGNWQTVQGGVGYSPGAYDQFVDTTVRPGDACGDCTSIYTRIPIEITDLDDILDLRLDLQYDDGFVAYLNGTEVAKSVLLEAPAYNTVPFFNIQHAGDIVQEFDLSNFQDVLVEGTNILAIHSFNVSATDNDQLMLAKVWNGDFNTVEVDVAGIPHEQTAGIGLAFDDTLFDVDPVSGNQDEEFLKLDNPNDDAVDISGWRLEGGVTHTFKKGTVVEAGGSIFVSPSVPAFRARATGPSGGQGLFVQGDYKGHLSNLGETVQLVDSSDNLLDTFTVVPTISDNQRYLRISEINYNPDGSDSTEFLELVNISDSTTLDLSGVALTDGPSTPLSIDQGISLAPGDRVLFVADQAAFLAAYPSVSPNQIVGEYAGSLSNGGEEVKLDDVGGNTIMNVTYSDSDPWAAAADGRGATLVLNDLMANDDVIGKSYTWRASTEIGGSPGAESAEPIGVVVSEVLANTDPPNTQSDAIELHNTTSSDINIGGWYLSDSSEPKYQIPADTILSAGGFIVFDESDFNPTPEAPGPNDFALSSDGDDVWLLTGDLIVPTQFADFVQFNGTASGESIGRTAESNRLVPLAHTSLGCQSGHARVGPLVISEVNYRPGLPTAAAVALHQDMTRDDLEFVEIHNPTDGDIDLTNWRLRGGVDFDFAPASMLSAGETLIILSFNPENAGNANRLAALREHYALDVDQRLVGGYGNQLANDGEPVRLERPEEPIPTGGFVHSTQDEVFYDDLAPWPTASDGDGASLQRTVPSGFGSQASSWSAADPTPGSVSFAGVAGDLSGDGVVNSVDIDMLNTAIQNGWNTDSYDVDHSGSVDELDRTHLVQNILGTFLGDANLDFSVTSADLNILGIHWQQIGCVNWAAGDFNGDNQVDSSDLNDIGINWQSVAAPAAARVPRAPLASRSQVPIIGGALAETSRLEKGDYKNDLNESDVTIEMVATDVVRSHYRREATNNRRLGRNDTNTKQERLDDFWAIDSTDWR